MGGQIRMTGLISGLDTDAVVQQLVSAKSVKVTKKKNQQKKLEWKQEKWKSMNSQVYNFFKGKLDTFTMTSAFNEKGAKVADSAVASATAASSAVTGSHSLEVISLAQSSYLTGAALTGDKYADASSKIGSAGTIKITYKGQEKTIDISDDTSLSGIASKISSETGLTASYDAKNQRFFISGDSNDFEISGDLANSLGINVDSDGNSAGNYLKGAKAEITLDGATYTSDKNTFEINGLTINATKEGSSTITVDKDVDAVYNKIVAFFDEYNTIINAMDKAYNADAAKGYDVLTDEQKDALSDKEVEDWENKIKDSLLRRDKNLGDVIDIFKDAMSYSYTDSSGTKYTLADFGMGTLSYFLAKENERNAIHIDGNEKDDDTKSEPDKLKSMIINNPDVLENFFSGLAKQFHTAMDKNMASVTNTRSRYKVYDDKALQSEYDKMKEDITAMEDKIAAIEDKYYKQFAAMETALAGLQEKQNALAGLLNM